MNVHTIYTICTCVSPTCGGEGCREQVPSPPRPRGSLSSVGIHGLAPREVATGHCPPSCLGGAGALLFPGDWGGILLLSREAVGREPWPRTAVWGVSVDISLNFHSAKKKKKVSNIGGRCPSAWEIFLSFLRCIGRKQDQKQSSWNSVATT